MESSEPQSHCAPHHHCGCGQRSGGSRRCRARTKNATSGAGRWLMWSMTSVSSEYGLTTRTGPNTSSSAILMSSTTSRTIVGAILRVARSGSDSPAGATVSTLAPLARASSINPTTGRSWPRSRRAVVVVGRHHRDDGRRADPAVDPQYCKLYSIYTRMPVRSTMPESSSGKRSAGRHGRRDVRPPS